ncbi:MAG: hypothetical protein JXR05_05505 [Flavobacteriaceae bacterium]
MKKHISLSIILLLATLSSAQNEKPERTSFTLNVAVDSLNYYNQEIPKSPYFVSSKVLQIYPSEKLFVEVEINKDSIYSMKVVKQNLHPEKTIIIDFNQEVKGRKSERMMLLKLKTLLIKF